MIILTGVKSVCMSKIRLPNKESGIKILIEISAFKVWGGGRGTDA